MTTSKPAADAAKADGQVRPFASFLREQNKGRTHDELSEQLNELVGRVAETGKKGSITLTVEVKPLAKGDSSTVLVTDKVTAKLPSFDRAQSIFFVSDDHNLQREDPRQMHLPLRGVPSDVDDTDQPADTAGSAQ